MQVTRKNLTATKVQLTLVADPELLQTAKDQTLQKLRRDMALPGFRKGKAPLDLVEKNATIETMQTEFLDRAMNALYAAALNQEKLRPVAQPEVKVNKVVPFQTLEIDVTVEVLGEITLPDYKKITLAKTPIKISDKDIDDVLKQLALREATRTDVDRAAKDGDEVIIDFAGVEAKTKKPISGADGKDYPLVLGGNSFIPGFEPELVGLKAGADKTFSITFPKDYGAPSLQNAKVDFSVSVKKVQSVTKPKIDDALAVKVGPFKTLDELKADITKQLENERRQQADRDYESALLEKVAQEATVAIPESIIDEEVNRIESEEKQNLVYRGQTWQEHLDEEGISEAEHHEQKRPQAEDRVKAGLVLAEIAQAEKLDVSDEELDVRLQLLKGQYEDQAMQAELDKPENRREIASRILTEKTIEKLTGYATS